MRDLNRLAFALGLVALLAGPASAQRRMDVDAGINPELVSHRDVQKELKLDDQQVEKANKLADEYRGKYRDNFRKINDASEGERAEKARELFSATSEELRKELSGLLKPEQMKRFEQISLQQRGVAALNAPEVREALKLTADQQKQVREISTRTGEQARELFRDRGKRAEATEKRRALQKEAMEKVAALLTEDQKKAWGQLIGDPFEVKFERRDRPSRGR